MCCFVLLVFVKLDAVSFKYDIYRLPIHQRVRSSSELLYLTITSHCSTLHKHL